MRELSEEFFRKQITGLKMILNDTNKKEFIARDYVIEKLNMILSGGIGFHPTIKELLERDDWEKYNEKDERRRT